MKGITYAQLAKARKPRYWRVFNTGKFRSWRKNRGMKVLRQFMNEHLKREQSQ